MKDKKKYGIFKATCTVSRLGGIKEKDEFALLYDWTTMLVLSVNSFLTDDLNKLLQKQIDFFNEFCPNDWQIIKYEDAEFEQVGEIWL